MGKKSKRRRRSRAPEAGPREDWKRAVEPGPLAPHAYPLSALVEWAQPELADVFGVSPKGPDLPQRLARAMADPQRVHAILRDLPVQALLVLEVLSELGGLAEMDVLATTLTNRHSGVDLPVEPLGDLLANRGLCSWGSDRRTGTECLMMLTPCAEIIAPALAGVSLPADPPARDAQPHPPREARDMLALAALTAHRRARLTQSGTIDRTLLKTFGKKLGPDRSVIEDALGAAFDLDLLGVRPGHQQLVPEALRLLRYAKGEGFAASARLPSGAGIRGLLEALPDDGWFPREALDRWVASRVHRMTSWFRSPPPWLQPLELIRSGVLEATEVAGATWLRRRAPGGSAEWRGDGHVTPSFEVMLGPGASLEVVALVGLVAELVHLDHVLTFKLGPASVAAGIAAGVAPDDLWRALRSVGPHGLPSNVETLVADWVHKARVGRLEKGWFLFVPPEHEDELVHGPLAPYVVAVRAPGAIALAGSTPRVLLDEVLQKAGIRLGGGDASKAGRSSDHGPLLDRVPPPTAPWELIDGDDYDDDDFDDLDDLDDLLPFPDGLPSPFAEMAEPLRRPRPDAELRRRVHEGLKEGLEPLRFVKTSGDPLEDARNVVEHFRLDAEARHAPPLVMRWLDALDGLWKGRFDELARWYRGLPESHQSDALHELGFPLLWLPWLMLDDKWRRRALQKKSALSVLAESDRLSRPNRLDPEAAQLIPILADAEVHEWMHAQFEQSDESPPKVSPLHLVDAPSDGSEGPLGG
ncbi:MAG: hypothetical protein ACOCXM_06000 [Myxococcota bacterium]